jgi:S1-C subfamily serine protease
MDGRGGGHAGSRPAAEAPLDLADGRLPATDRIFHSMKPQARWSLPLVWLLLLLAVGPNFCAAEYRTWTAAAGGFKTEGEFMELRDGRVRMRLRSGGEREVALEKLSPADQDYVRSQNEKPGGARTDRVAKLEREAADCQTAEEALRLYRVFREDPQTTRAEREAISARFDELYVLAEKKMIRIGSKWATPEEFRERRNRANSLMKLGLEMLRLKQEEAFRSKFAEAAKVEPESIRADFMIGMLYSMLSSNYTKSKQYFDACAKREPNNVAVLNNVALAAMRRGDMNTAITNWRRAVKLGPNQCITQNLGRLVDQAAKNKISVPKASLDTAINMYGTLLTSEKFERADLKKGWMWMFIDEESMSLAKQGEKGKTVESAAPKAAEDGSVVISGGTGFVVYPQYILTNNHVVDGGTSYDIQTSEGSKDTLLRATLVARSEKPDLALLHCPDLDASPVPIDPAPLGRGTDIMTLGYPEMFVLGASLKATRGVISAVPSSAVEDMYLYDAVVNHGNSGGPVCDSRGNVVAVTTIMTNTEGKYGGGIPGAAALAFVQKHVPGFERIEPSEEKLEWPAVDQRVSPSTVLIWTRSKTPGNSVAAGSAGYYEDRDCLVCNGLSVLRCSAPGCVNGMVATRSSRNVTVAACTHCGGKGLVPCPICKGTGIDPDCVRVQPTPPPSTRPRTNPPPSARPPRTVIFGQPSIKQPKNDGSSLAWRDFVLDKRLHDRLHNAVRDNQTVDTALAGSGEKQFRAVNRDGGILIGLYFHVCDFRGATVINSVKPMYYNARGRDRGNYYGPPGGDMVSAIARPGYAVGGINVRSGLGIDSVSLIYMRINGDRLDPRDAYESPVYGGSGGQGRPPQLLGGTGEPIVGIYGRLPNDPDSAFIGLGLITVTGN